MGEEDACDLWTGPPSSGGYGKVSFQGRTMEVYRVIWILLGNTITPGYVLDHTCHNVALDCPGGVTCPHRLCVKPTHLQEVPRGKNVLAGRTLSAVNATKTHCPQGHPYSPENTKIETDGSRKCLICRRAYDRRRGQEGGDRHVARRRLD